MSDLKQWFSLDVSLVKSTSPELTEYSYKQPNARHTKENLQKKLC